jgi:hypothetical protein
MSLPFAWVLASILALELRYPHSVQKQLRLGIVAFAGALYVWYAAVHNAGRVKARKAAWRQARARR